MSDRKEIISELEVINKSIQQLSEQPETAETKAALSKLRLNQYVVQMKLNKLQKELGFAMVFVSHDLALVAEVANSITVMYAGQVVEQGPVKEILTNPIHEYTQGLLGSVLSIEAHDGSRLHQVPGSVPSPADFPAGDRFAPRSSHPDVGLDVKPVLKPVPGADHHFVAEIPDAELAKAGLKSRLEVR